MTCLCLANGTWESKPNYSNCKPILPVGSDVELKCIRNRIHINLIISYILTDILFIVNYKNPFSSELLECFFFIFYTYFLTTSYFWMFVEGFHLYLIAIKPFSIEKMKMSFYNLLGWGLSAIFMVIWTAFKYVYSKSEDT